MVLSTAPPPRLRFTQAVLPQEDTHPSPSPGGRWRQPEGLVTEGGNGSHHLSSPTSPSFHSGGPPPGGHSKQPLAPGRARLPHSHNCAFARIHPHDRTGKGQARHLAGCGRRRGPNSQSTGTGHFRGSDRRIIGPVVVNHPITQRRAAELATKPFGNVPCTSNSVQKYALEAHFICRYQE